MKLILSISLLAAAMNAQAQRSNTHFSHTLETTAPPEKVWRIWTDVPNWKEWDGGLQSAELLGPFQQGAKGILVPDKGPKSKFVIDVVVPNESYTFKTKLPLGTLYVKRYLTVSEGKTRFTHEVWFTGLTKGLFGKTLGKNYRMMLPEVMKKISVLAEGR
ncbi:MAG: SRPBCC family protein [Ferruginibacter sp.]|nr:SRPBCC family protein [Cytophagales bacterium]